jgi:glycosyltransferase involved in cell wall biosynthesis
MAWVRRRIADYVREDGRFDLVDVPPVAVSHALTSQCATVARSVQPDLQYLFAEVMHGGRLGRWGPFMWLVTFLFNTYLAALVVAGWFRARGILCLGGLEYAWMRRWFPWWRSKTAMYVNALDDAERSELARIRDLRSAPPGPGLRLLWLGRWVAHKGADVFADFIEVHLREAPSDTITIAGCGPGVDLRLPVELVRSGRIRVLPSYERRDLPGLLAANDVGLFTSRTEGWGLTLHEMLESGMPVYATMAGAVHDLKGDFPRQLRAFPRVLPGDVEPLVPDNPGEAYFMKFCLPAISKAYEEFAGAVKRRDRNGESG